jgi:hypothetical protein
MNKRKITSDNDLFTFKNRNNNKRVKTIKNYLFDIIDVNSETNDDSDEINTLDEIYNNCNSISLDNLYCPMEKLSIGSKYYSL